MLAVEIPSLIPPTDEEQSPPSDEDGGGDSDPASEDPAYKPKLEKADGNACSNFFRKVRQKIKSRVISLRLMESLLHYLLLQIQLQM